MQRISAWISQEPESAWPSAPANLRRNPCSSLEMPQQQSGENGSPAPQQLRRPVNTDRMDSDHCEPMEHYDHGSGHVDRPMPLFGVGGPGQSGVEEDPGVLPAMSGAARAVAARECKRLLDRGRVWFVQEKLGLTCELVHFVEREVTPENALLLAFRA